MNFKTLPTRSKMLFLVFSIFFISIFSNSTKAATRDFYVLKVYRMKDQSQVDRVDKYLKDAYLPAIHRAGVKTVGVFKPIENTDAERSIFVWMPIKSLDQLTKLRETIERDSEYMAAGSDYIESAFSNPPYNRIETILLKSFEDMPQFNKPSHQTAPSERVYELRSYEGPTEQLFQRKMEMFNAGGEIKLFEKLNFNAVFYAEVIAGSTMPNLMYMTTFQNMKAHDEHWDAFRNHPEWKALSAIEKYKHSVSKATKYLLYPTEYSDL